MVRSLELCAVFAAAILLACGTLARFRLYRSLFHMSSVLMLIAVLFPWPGGLIEADLFGASAPTIRWPSELFAVACWMLGAWLLKSILQLVLRRTMFPDDNQPHARRLFADLISGLIYVVAGAGILNTVLKQPISTVLATSGVFAIILGLALQNTLSDVFSGLVINIERSFRAGDWITVTGGADGQVIEVNWRTTRIRTQFNDMIAIPNSVISKAMVTNHSRLNDPHISTVEVMIDHTVAPALVIDALQTAAMASGQHEPGSVPTAYACGFSDALAIYELAYPVRNVALASKIRSDIVLRVTGECLSRGIEIGASATDVRIIQRTDPAIPRPLALARREAG